jgi:hypothetical protein
MPVAESTENRPKGGIVKLTILSGIAAASLAVVQPLHADSGPAAPVHSNVPPATQTRQSLYALLDTYLAALKAKDAARAPWAEGAVYTENNVTLKPGDGLWQTITALGNYDFRFADAQTGSVAFYGTVKETVTDSPFALRLKITDGRIAAAETVVARPPDAGVPFVSANLTTRPELNEVLPPAQRISRERMIAVANGYFDTLQRNDGTLHSEFEPGCNRRENGMQTTNHPNSGYAGMELGCAEQFKLGIYRYDDALRARRFPLVDQERGLVLASAFIDHSGRLGAYTLTNGSAATSMFRRPHSFYLVEAFRIRSGRIQSIEAVFTTVPYGMPSPWSAKESGQRPVSGR